MNKRALFVLLISLGAASSAAAATPSPAPSPTPACQEPQFRQFDFWLGKWNVKDPKGVQVGSSEISRVSEGCAVREQWRAAGGQGGTSLNYYDASDREWHQDWVGGDGTILHLHGGLQGDVMILGNTMKTSKGTYRNRITYTPMPRREGATGMGRLDRRREDLAGLVSRRLREGRGVRLSPVSCFFLRAPAFDLFGKTDVQEQRGRERGPKT